MFVKRSNAAGCKQTLRIYVYCIRSRVILYINGIVTRQDTRLFNPSKRKTQIIVVDLLVNQICSLVSAFPQILRQLFFFFFLSCSHRPECSFKTPHNAPRCPEAVAMLEQYGGVSRRMRRYPAWKLFPLLVSLLVSFCLLLQETLHISLQSLYNGYPRPASVLIDRKMCKTAFRCPFLHQTSDAVTSGLGRTAKTGCFLQATD